MDWKSEVPYLSKVTQSINVGAKIQSGLCWAPKLCALPSALLVEMPPCSLQFGSRRSNHISGLLIQIVQYWLKMR